MTAPEVEFPDHDAGWEIHEPDEIKPLRFIHLENPPEWIEERLASLVGRQLSVVD